ncbi:unnamed protein product [Lasius platythorax]|uniref:Uncharacterized protein n=1 Tax=Lasius platythorax TaxID=488582 RepID=A0AAV2MZY9_9HYME
MSKSKFTELVKNVENLDQNIDDDVAISNPSSSSIQSHKKRKVEKMETKSRFVSPGTASATLMKYMLERNEKASQQQVIYQLMHFLLG